MAWRRLTFAALAALSATGAPSLAGEDAAGAVELARERNRKAYEAAKPDLHAKHTGEWVVIADGKVAAYGKRPEDVQTTAPDAAHRYLFEVGKEGDGEFVANFWYGPRFGGGALAGALGITTFGAEDDDPATAFPRTKVVLSTPSGQREEMDVLVGTVGPPLLVTLDDAARLNLSRYEVPGTLTASWLPFGFRRATVRVSQPKHEGGAWLSAAVPMGTRAQLVELTRGRDSGYFEDRFGVWAMDPWAAKRRSLTGKWALVGVDRLLAEGATAEEALLAGEGKAPEAYMRYLTQMPIPGEMLLAEDLFTEKVKQVLNGLAVEVRRAVKEDVLLTDAATAARLRLELAEAMRCVFLLRNGEKIPARMGAAWTPPQGPGKTARLMWLVYALPAGETVWHCKPLPELPGDPVPAGK
jgi:hypothetical protein